MAKYPGLVRRGKRGTYWFRRRIPANLIARLDIGPEIIKSLRTRDYKDAIELWAVEDAAARKLFSSELEERQPAASHADIVKAFEQEMRILELTYRMRHTAKTDDGWFELAAHHRTRLQEKIATAKMRAVTMRTAENTCAGYGESSGGRDRSPR